LELKINLNTLNGQNSFKTEKISGFLDAIIIDSYWKIEIIIESELGHLIFKRAEHKGIKYYPVRIESIPNIDDRFSKLVKTSPQTINLNEKLIITVIGKKNEEVKLILRTI